MKSPVEFDMEIKQRVIIVGYAIEKFNVDILLYSLVKNIGGIGI